MFGVRCLCSCVLRLPRVVDFVLRACIWSATQRAAFQNDMPHVVPRSRESSARGARAKILVYIYIYIWIVRLLSTFDRNFR